jgi:preprotein translocase subunit SecG
MFKIILLITAMIGGALAILSSAQNLFLLFFGLGTLAVSILALWFKKSAKILVFPFIILLGAVLFFLNTFELYPNQLKIDIADPAGFSTSFAVNGRVYPVGSVFPGLAFESVEDFEFRFEKAPILLPDHFILSRTHRDGIDATADWHWSGTPRWIPIAEEEYLHIYDPLLNIYYPDAVTALLLADRLEFSLLNFSVPGRPGSIKLTINDLFYLSEPANIHFGSPLTHLIIQTDASRPQTIFEVRVNEEPLKFERLDGNKHIFSFVDQGTTIDTLQIFEKSQPYTQTLQSLKPSFTAIFVVESDPQPIVIENIALSTYIGRLNRSLPFYSWGAEAISTDFSPAGAGMTIEQSLLKLTSTDTRLTLHLNQSPQRINALGMANLPPLLQTANILITIALLLAFTLVVLVINRYGQSIQMGLKRSGQFTKQLFRRRPVKISLPKLTPFRLAFLFFLIISWIVFIGSGVNLFLLLIALLLNLIMLYFVITDRELDQ